VQVARRQYKRVKAAVADMQQSLAEAEAKLQRAGIRAPVKRTPRTKAPTRARSKTAAKSIRKVARRKPARPPKARKPAVARRRRKLPIALPLSDRPAAETTTISSPKTSELQIVPTTPAPIIYEQEPHREERQAEDEEI
jgi:hypothetical protein